MQRNNGFTLIELMVTIVVVVIIATMAIPSFNSLIQNQNLTKSTDSLVREIRSVRSKAVLNNRETTLKLASTSSDTDYVINWSPAGSVRLGDSGSGKDELKFNGKGVLTSFGVLSVVELCKTSGASKSKKITLTALGQIAKVEEGNCT